MGKYWWYFKIKIHSLFFVLLVWLINIDAIWNAICRGQAHHFGSKVVPIVWISMIYIIWSNILFRGNSWGWDWLSTCCPDLELLLEMFWWGHLCDVQLEFINCSYVIMNVDPPPKESIGSWCWFIDEITDLQLQHNSCIKRLVERQRFVGETQLSRMHAHVKAADGVFTTWLRIAHAKAKSNHVISGRQISLHFCCYTLA